MHGAGELFEAMKSVPRNRDNIGSSFSIRHESAVFGTSVIFSPLNVSVEVFSLILEAAEDQVKVSSFREQDTEKVSHPYGCLSTMKGAN